MHWVVERNDLALLKILIDSEAYVGIEERKNTDLAVTMLTELRHHNLRACRLTSGSRFTKLHPR